MKKPQIAIGGQIVASHMEGNVKVITEFKLFEASVISNMKPIFKVSSTEIVEDENELVITKTGKYLDEGTLEEFVDRCNKYL